MMYDVVVVGAGIAGLAAAQLLSRESYNVLVLEARSRPGGRIHSVRLPPISSTSSACLSSETLNCDHLSVHHFKTSSTEIQSRKRSVTPESDDSNMESQSSAADQDPESPIKDSSSNPYNSVSDPSGPIDVDLGANYLIGCSNRQADQPLFHLARMLRIPTAVAAGDLCKKYRGWECVEIASWIDHYSPYSPKISMERVADGVFLFDKVIHLAVDRYLEMKCKLNSINLSVKDFFDQALENILDAEARCGLRPTRNFMDATEKGIFDSVVSRYLAYVNPIDRLPLCVLDDLCEIANKRWQSNISDNKSNSVLNITDNNNNNLTSNQHSLADQLVQSYPTIDQREAYQIWAERKFNALTNNDQCCLSNVASSVNVCWEDRLVTSSFSDLIKPLINKVNIIYNAVVVKIDWSGNNIHNSENHYKIFIHTQISNNDKLSTKLIIYEAKHCIITVPVGVLKGLCPDSQITFHPPLPHEKQKAIERLGIPVKGAATHDKVILRFKYPEDIFWDVKAAHIKCPDPRLHILNLHRYGKLGILCAHLWGGAGLNPHERTDEEVVEIILDLLDHMYSKTLSTQDDIETTKLPKRKRTIPNPVYYVVTRWSDDPYALGAYTTGEPGSSDADRSLYAASLTDADAKKSSISNGGIVKSEESNCAHSKANAESVYESENIPRLLFAGEGTLTASEAKECTHGALQTGIARAIELLPFLIKSLQTSFHDPGIQRSLEILKSNSCTNFSNFSAKLASYLAGRVRLNRLLNCNLANGKQFTPMVLTRSSEKPLRNIIKTDEDMKSKLSSSLMLGSPRLRGPRKRHYGSSRAISYSDSEDSKCCSYSVVKRSRGRGRPCRLQCGRGRPRGSLSSDTTLKRPRGRPAIRSSRGLAYGFSRVGDLRNNIISHLTLLAKNLPFSMKNENNEHQSRRITLKNKLRYIRTNGRLLNRSYGTNQPKVSKRGRPRKIATSGFQTCGTSWGDLSEEDRNETLCGLTNLLNEMRNPNKDLTCNANCHVVLENHLNSTADDDNTNTNLKNNQNKNSNHKIHENGDICAV